MISYLAQLYVNVLEPGLRVFAVVALVMAALYVFNVLRGGKDDAITKLVNGFFKIIYKTVCLFGVLVVKVMRGLIKRLMLVFSVIRDFFTSRDL
jgi:hypothetical protein